MVDLVTQYHSYQSEIDAAISKVLNSGQFIMGPEVLALEGGLAKYTGARHAITCANGTDALQIALMAIGVGPGDEVITTPFTFAATAEAILILGAKPVYVDIEPDTYLIDATQIEAKLNEKTKAILPVSLYGQIPDMDVINNISLEASKRFGHKIYVIEDAAQSFGATYHGKKSCNVSDIACTSFFPTKPLGCYGDGGAVFTSDNALAEVIKQIRVHGQNGRYKHIRLGLNSRLDTIQAAVLLVKLKYFDDEVLKRQTLAHRYTDFLDKCSVITPDLKPGRTHVFGQYTIQVDKRVVLQESLKARGFGTAVHYPIPIHRQEAYLKSVSCPNAERVSKRVLSLPMHPFLSEADHNRMLKILEEELQEVSVYE